MILSCTCTHEYQDSKYGKGMRVFNPTKKGYRCTVCKKERGAPEPKKAKKVEE